MTPVVFRLAELRKARGWSQRELGRRTGVRQATLSLYESGRAKSVELEILERLAAALGCDPGYLLVRVNSPRKRSH